MRDATEVVTAYWAAANAEGLVRLRSPARRRMSSTKDPRLGNESVAVANYVRFNVEGFPGDWHLEVNRIIGEGLHASSWIQFTNADGISPAGAVLLRSTRGRHHRPYHRLLARSVRAPRNTERISSKGTDSSL